MMNKLLILFFLLITAFTYSQSLDGNYWMNMTPDERITYLYGAANENYVLIIQLINDGKLTEETANFYMIIGESYEIVVEEITMFYIKTELYDYSIALAIHIRNNWKYIDPEEQV